MKRKDYTIIYVLKQAILTYSARDEKYISNVTVLGHYDTYKQAKEAEAEAFKTAKPGVCFKIDRLYY